MAKTEMLQHGEYVLPAPMGISLPVDGGPVKRPDPGLVRKLHGVSSATASATLHKMGLRNSFIGGVPSRKPGSKAVGPAVTLAFMPQREDIASGLGQEQTEKRSALWAVFESVEPGDVLCIQAFGDIYTGCVGEMLSTYFCGRGGVAMVVDGCVRDWPQIQELDLPLWSRGVTPNYASQSRLFPFAFNVPVACSQVTVLPGDVIIADDDGAVMIPQQMIEDVLTHTLHHEDWEVFSRMKLREGGDLSVYYPLSEQGWAEYEEWQRARDSRGSSN